MTNDFENFIFGIVIYGKINFINLNFIVLKSDIIHFLLFRIFQEVQSKKKSCT